MAGSVSAGRARTVARDVVVILVLLTVLGVLCGVVWELVVTPAQFTKVAGGGAMDEDALGRQFAADGWYVVIALVAGLLAGVVLTWWRSREVVWTCAALLAGAALAAAAMALTGHLLGPGDPGPALRAAKVGAKVPERLDVGEGHWTSVWDYLANTVIVYLSWPIGLLAGALAVLLVRRDRFADGRFGESPEARRESADSLSHEGWTP